MIAWACKGNIDECEKVLPGDECPVCGENRVDFLTIQEGQQFKVKCYNCNTEYHLKGGE